MNAGSSHDVPRSFRHRERPSRDHDKGTLGLLTRDEAICAGATHIADQQMCCRRAEPTPCGVFENTACSEMDRFVGPVRIGRSRLAVFGRATS